MKVELMTMATMVALCTNVRAGETLPRLKDGIAPATVDEVWAGFDPRKEPLDVEVIKEWEEEDTVIKIIRYRIGIFKGEKAMMAAVYGYPKGASNLPAIVQLHGGGQSAQDAFVLANAKNGYATISVAWSGRITSSNYLVTNKEKEMFWTGNVDDPDYRVTTDWGPIDGYHHHVRYHGNNFVLNPPSTSTVDAVKSPRNSGWFLATLGARRAITFLEAQKEVDPDRIGVFGMSMGGKLSVLLAGCDERIKVAVPGCGGITDRSERGQTLGPLSDDSYLKRITCPIMFMSPANDFHSHVEDLPQAVGDVQSEDWRIVSSPNRNHGDTAEYFAGGTLWLDQFLKGTFSMPETPQGKLVLETEDHVPAFMVKPDSSKEIVSVAIYYTADGERKPVKRFWRKAVSTEEDGVWKAALPILNVEEPLWVYADVEYALDQEISGVGYSGERFTTNRFHLASPVQLADPEDLKAAGVVSSGMEMRPEVLESFENLWEGWSQEATHNRYRKPVFGLPEYRAPRADAKLVLDVRSKQPNKLVVGIDNFATTVELTGGPEWQTISFMPSDFDDGDGNKLPSWDDIRDFMVGEYIRLGKDLVLFGGPWTGEKADFRNLRWE